MNRQDAEVAKQKFSRVEPSPELEILSYLRRATRHQLGLLINFNVPMLRHGIKRVIHNP